MFVGGAPPSPALLERAARSSTSHITHLYGLTETYGPLAVCAWNPDWDDLDDERAGAAARAPGRRHRRVASALRVVDEDMERRARRRRDARRGRDARRQRDDRLLDDEEATREAFKGGWFHSGDLGVMHEDGYVELRDRLKDVIISGGENIATIEVEQALAAHDVGRRGRGRRRARTSAGARCPVAFVTAPAATSPTSRRCRSSRASGSRKFKVPKRIVVRRRAAQDRHRQDPEVRAARAGRGGRGEVDWLRCTPRSFTSTARRRGTRSSRSRRRRRGRSSSRSPPPRSTTSTC